MHCGFHCIHTTAQEDDSNSTAGRRARRARPAEPTIWAGLTIWGRGTGTAHNTDRVQLATHGPQTTLDTPLSVRSDSGRCTLTLTLTHHGSDSAPASAAVLGQCKPWSGHGGCCRLAVKAGVLWCFHPLLFRFVIV